MRRVLAVCLACVVLAVGGCSDDPEIFRPGNNGTLAPKTTGASCSDPKSDISGDPARSGSRAEPSGIDIISVDAKITATTLKVTYEMAGPVAAAPTPTFILSQGVAAQTVSFEVRASPGKDPAQPWPLELVSWKVNTRGTEEERRPLAEVATVTGSTLTYEVPLSNLPPIATLIWNFGATAGGGGGLIDDCSSYDTSNSTLPPETSPGSVGPTTTVPDAKLGEPQIHPKGGEKITVFEVQDPPTKPKTLTVPIDADRRLVAINVEFCASPDRPASARARQFGVMLVSNEIYPVWAEAQGVTDSNYPAFPFSQTLEPGKCVRAWVFFSLPIGVAIFDVFYSENPSGDDVVLWKVGPPPPAATTTTTP